LQAKKTKKKHTHRDRMKEPAVLVLWEPWKNLRVLTKAPGGTKVSLGGFSEPLLCTSRTALMPGRSGALLNTRPTAVDSPGLAGYFFLKGPSGRFFLGKFSGVHTGYQITWW
jgi:hypothetical protein